MPNYCWILLDSYLMLLVILIYIKHVRIYHDELPTHAIKFIQDNCFNLMFWIHMNPKIIIIKQSINCNIRGVSCLINSTSSRLYE